MTGSRSGSSLSSVRRRGSAGGEDGADVADAGLAQIEEVSDDVRDITNFKPARATADEKRARRRDRHGWRTAPKTSRHGGLTSAGEKAEKKRHENTVRSETRGKVWARSQTCECCGDTEDQTARKYWKGTHEAHEVVPRAQTRNLPPEFRFSTENTARLCCFCHRQWHDGRWRFDFHSDLRMDGPYSVRFK
jgi:hypothetical protein